MRALILLILQVYAPFMRNGVATASQDSPTSIPRVRRQSVLLNEVTDPPGRQSDRGGNDDYTDFNSRPVENGGANRKLEVVTLSPERSTTESFDAPVVRVPRPRRPPPPRRLPPLHPAYVHRVGYYFQHYPYDQLPRFYQLNPQLYYTYPREYENVQWVYPISKTRYFRERQFYDLSSLGYYGR